MEYIIQLTETTKAFPKKCYYQYETGSILHTTNLKSEAFKCASKEGAIILMKDIEEMYDYSTELIELDIEPTDDEKKVIRKYLDNEVYNLLSK